MTKPFHELLEPTVATHASTAVSGSNMGAIEKVAGVSIAISLKRIADSLDKIVEAQTMAAFPVLKLEQTELVEAKMAKVSKS